ncbi:hypothetical protein H1R20_g3547, partial [Candolleomyces eurysporus]
MLHLFVSGICPQPSMLDTIDPILGTLDPAMSCNNDGGPVGEGGTQLSANIKAGTNITAVYGLWLHPYGPATVYMARCPGSCTDSNSRELKWFKIDHVGLIRGTIVYAASTWFRFILDQPLSACRDGDWGSGVVSKTGVYTVTIPAALADGEYLIRHELIAIHAYWAGPQFYIECAQLKVVGGRGKLPSDEYLVSFPGAYKASDPGLNVDLYSPEAPTITTYELPGPAVWTGED